MKMKDRVLPTITIPVLPTTNRTQPAKFYFQNSIPAGIVDELAKLSSGGWNEPSKAPITSNPLLCFRVKFHSAQKLIRHGGTELRTASESSSACKGNCQR